MKKIIHLFGTIAFVLSSCSSEIPNSNDSEGEVMLLLKGITSDSYSGANIITYEGNKIVEKQNPDGHETYSTTYTYDGDLITKEKTVRKNSNGDYSEITFVEYFYENGKLSSSLSKSSDSWSSDGTSLHDRNNYKYEYVYNSDGSITSNYYYYDSQGIAQLAYFRKYTFLNGNLIKLEIFDKDGTTSLSTIISKYDNKKNPFSNIVGYGQLNDFQSSSKNNLVEYTLIANTYTKTVKNVYKYNSKGYPEKISSTDVEATNGKSTNTNVYNTQYYY